MRSTHRSADQKGEHRIGVSQSFFPMSRIFNLMHSNVISSNQRYQQNTKNGWLGHGREVEQTQARDHTINHSQQKSEKKDQASAAVHQIPPNPLMLSASEAERFCFCFYSMENGGVFMVITHCVQRRKREQQAIKRVGRENTPIDAAVADLCRQQSALPPALSICLSVCLPAVCPSVRPSVRLSYLAKQCQSVCLSVCLLSVSLSAVSLTSLSVVV